MKTRTMKTRTKGKELIKAAVVCVMSVGLFSAAFVGFNQMIFAAATNEPTPLIISPTAADYTAFPDGQAAEYEENVFAAPTLTVVENPNQYFKIPAVAMSIEEAAQIGARYIWDVFGESIDGMYVEMTFGAWPSQSRTYWQGVVRAEAFDLESFADGDIEARIALNDTMMYRFSIDAVTGMRVDITSDFLRSVPLEELQNRAMDERHAMIEANWWEMDLDGRLTFLGIGIADIA